MKITITIEDEDSGSVKVKTDFGDYPEDQKTTPAFGAWKAAMESMSAKATKSEIVELED